MEMDDRGNLEGPPPGMQTGTPPPPPPGPDHAPRPAATASSGFDFNQPTIISLLYLGSFVLGVTAIVGVVLAYTQRDQAQPWEVSHYEYLIRTFWIGLIGIALGIPLMFLLIGFVIFPAAMVLVVVRSVLSIVNAQKHEPMPNPSTWIA